MPDTILEWVRLANIIVAGLALFLNVFKAYHLKLISNMPMDAAIGFMAVLAWCMGYSSATSIAWSSGVPAGIWSLIMAIPCWWSLVAGLLGWKPRKPEHSQAVRSGTITATEYRDVFNRRKGIL